jgi:hypothetical protein
MSIPRDTLFGADSLTIDLVVEGVCWLAEHGVCPLRISLRGK